VIDDTAGDAVMRSYLMHLEFYEQQLAGFRRQTVLLAGGTTALPADESVEPRAAYERLHTIRQAYEARVEQIKAIMPQLSDRALWADPAKLTHALEKAQFEHKNELGQLELLDATLAGASHQATSSLMHHADMTDDTLRDLVKSEVAAANKAIDHRRYECGLVFDSELDALLAQRGKDEDKIFATQLDIATRAASAQPAVPPHPFTDLEVAALHSGSFSSRDAKLTSTEAQLAQLRDAMAKAKGKMFGQYRVVDRQFFLVTPNFRQWDDHAWFKNVDHHSYSPGLSPIVVKLEDHWQLGSLIYGVFGTVAPVNADAVAVLGTEPVKINLRDLVPISYNAILEAARQKSKP